MNPTEGLCRPNGDNGPIRPLLYYTPQNVLQSTIYTENKCCITFAVCPDHPLTFESIQVHLVYIADELKHCSIPLPFVWCYYVTPRRNMAGVIFQ